MEVPDYDTMVGTYVNKVGPVRGRRITKELGAKETLKEKFAYVWNTKEAHQYFEPIKVMAEKSQRDSERLRGQGSMYYKQKEYTKALKYFTLSIVSAPHPMETKESSLVNTQEGDTTNKEDDQKYKSLAWGYCNRSAVLLHLKHYDECLQDIELAMLYVDSPVLQKLEERKSKCINEKGSTLKDKRPLLPTLKKENHNPTLLPLSSAVKMEYTPAKGRHLVTTRDIYPGEMLGVEESYCHWLETEYMLSYCNICIAECVAPLPCPTCTRVVYCSSSCRARGQQDHALECELLSSFLALKCSYKHIFLAIKMLSHIPYVKLKSLLPQLEKEEKYYPKLMHGFDKEGIYRSDYSSLYHLVTDYRKRSKELLYTLCTQAFILNKLLQQSGTYFVDENGTPFTPADEDLIITGEAMLRHLLQVDCNNHPIEVVKEIEGKFQIIQIGTGLYPALCLMNHSCNPTTIYYSYGSSIVLRSIRTTPRGGEITECYGRPYYLQSYTTRRKKLKDTFLLNCYCEACENKWPCLESLGGILVKCVVCQKPLPRKMIRCSRCSMNYGYFEYEGEKKEDFEKWWLHVFTLDDAEKKCSSLLRNQLDACALSVDDILALTTLIYYLEKYAKLPCREQCIAIQLIGRAFKIKTYFEKQKPIDTNFSLEQL
ncbi:hypothetical protein SK128_012849 [Halocaridina rubra]|uniref:Protein-lysine N-methyltransferase SMYD4 n=1 Tax=Halocaridina rubra TaxID=373956 RepID=A0AAN8X2Q0_HALRR